MNWNTFVERWRSFSIIKKVVLVIVGCVALVVGLTIISYVGKSVQLFPNTNYATRGSVSGFSIGNMPSSGGYAPMPQVMYDSYNGGDKRATIAYESAATTKKAEDFELTTYSATIASRHIIDDCQKIQNLKADDGIIFLTANTGKDACNFTFKVEAKSLQKTLDTLKALDPKYMNEDIHTIEDTLLTYERRREILENELKTIDSILTDAVSSYESVSKLAIQTGSVSNLRQIITDKVDIVERLTQKKLSIEQELRSIGSSASSEKEEIAYTHFNVSMYSDTYIDKDTIVSSWKSEIKRFFNEINNSLQALTVGLLTSLLVILKYVLYILLTVVVLKYLKRIIVFIWNR